MVCLLCTCTALCTPSPLVSTSDSQTHGETHFLTKSIFIPICSNARRDPGKPVPKSAAVQRQLKRRSETKSKRGKEKKNPEVFVPGSQKLPSVVLRAKKQLGETKQSERIAAGVAELLALFWCRGLVSWRRRPRGCRCSLVKRPPEFGAKLG